MASDILSFVARLLTAHVLCEQMPHQLLTMSVQKQKKAPGLQSKPLHRL
jgi:hypothetical protein